MIAVRFANKKLIFFRRKAKFISHWIKPKKKKNLSEKFGSIPTFRSTRKGKKCFCDEPTYTSVWPQGITHYCISIKFFFVFAQIFSLFSLLFRTSKFLEFKEFNKTIIIIIPFALVGYETGYSQLGAMRLVVYLPSHIQHALNWKNC